MKRWPARHFPIAVAMLAFPFCLAAFPGPETSQNPSTDWPAFRGPWGNGYVTAPDSTNVAGLPLHWSETENVKWKIPIPFRGWSTPAIIDNQVWLTTASEDGHDFFAICLEANSGKTLFNTKLFHSDNPESLGPAGSGNPMNSYATPSPVAEKGRVYLTFGSYGTACLDTSNFKTLWQRQDLPCMHYRGPSSSPVLFENLLILTLDGADLQYTVALDKTDGHTVWKADRTALWQPNPVPGQNLKAGDMHKGHSSPLLVPSPGQPMLLSADADADTAYNPRTGEIIWRVRTKDYSPAPVPAYDRGMAFFVSGMGQGELIAVKPGGGGSTNADVVWRLKTHVGRYSSPIVVNGLLYTAAAESFITCIEDTTGEVVWTERIPGNYQASPLYADGHLFFCNQEGTTTVVKPGRTCEIVASNKLDDGLMASPAVSGRALFLRTKSSLYRIESAAEAR